MPTRGTKKDIGPGITHREKVLELYLRGQEPLSGSGRREVAVAWVAQGWPVATRRTRALRVCMGGAALLLAASMALLSLGLSPEGYYATRALDVLDGRSGYMELRHGEVFRIRMYGESGYFREQVGTFEIVRGGCVRIRGRLTSNRYEHRDLQRRPFRLVWPEEAMPGEPKECLVARRVLNPLVLRDLTPGARDSSR